MNPDWEALIKAFIALTECDAGQRPRYKAEFDEL